MTTLFLTAQGVEVVTAGERRRVDPHWFRGSSYFKIGWNWIKMALNRGWPIISAISFTTNQDLDPAKASHFQHKQKAYRIQFVVHDLNWAC
jgi:hypothetical protein